MSPKFSEFIDDFHTIYLFLESTLHIYKYLKLLVYQPHFNAINAICDNPNAPYQFGGRHEQDPEDVVAMLKYLMENTNGALGIFGPVEFLYSDLCKYFEPTIPDGVNYVDSMLRSYVSKESILPRCCELAMPDIVIDRELYQLLLNTYTVKVERQLGDTYELVSLHACEQLADGIQRFSRETKYGNLPLQVTESEWNALKPEGRLRKILIFWKFLNDESDRHIKKELEKYVMTARISHGAFLQIQHAHMVMEFIVSHDYIFKTLEEAEKTNCDDDKKFETFIRLFHDGNKKFLFFTDVRTEVYKALKRNCNGLPDDQLSRRYLKMKEEKEAEDKNGKYWVIPYARYLSILDKSGIRRDAITLVNVEVKRTRHLTRSISSPSGRGCKPIADIFYEILCMLTLELQVWWRLAPHQILDALRIIMAAMEEFIEPDERELFICVTNAKAAFESLRVLLKDMLHRSGAPFQKMEAFPEGQKPLTWNLLHQEIVRLKLVERFPKILDFVDIVFAKHIGFRGPTMITRLDLVMMVQECIGICFMSYFEEPKMFHMLRLCNLAPHVQCRLCDRIVKTPISISPQAVATVRVETEFEIRFDEFGIDDTIHQFLIDKSNQKKLITGEMARRFVLQASLQIPIQNSSNPVITGHSDDLKRIMRESGSKSMNFYLTDEEMLQLSVEVIKKFAAASQSSSSANFSDVKDRMKYVNRCMESLAALTEFFPDRKFFLKIRQKNGKGGRDGHVNSGELLEAVSIVMNQQEEAITKKELVHFKQLQKRWHSDLGWSFIPVGEALKTLKVLHVNPERFSFVPDIEGFVGTPDVNAADSTQQLLRPSDKPKKVSPTCEQVKLEEAPKVSEEPSASGTSDAPSTEQLPNAPKKKGKQKKEPVTKTIPQNDPEVAKIMAQKDQRIRALEQKLGERNKLISDLRSEKTALDRSHQKTLSDLNERAQENLILKGQQAETDSQMVELIQRNEQLTAQYRGILKQLRIEQLKNQAFQDQQSTSSGSAPLPDVPECNICLEEMDESAKTTPCNSCSAKWHTACISQWLAKEPTCTNCRCKQPNINMN